MIWHHRNVVDVNELAEIFSRAGITATENQIRDAADELLDGGWREDRDDHYTEDDITNAATNEREYLNEAWLQCLDAACGIATDEIIVAGEPSVRALDRSLEDWRHARQQDDIADGEVIYTGDLNRSERERVQAFIDSIRSEVA